MASADFIKQFTRAPIDVVALKQVFVCPQLTLIALFAAQRIAIELRVCACLLILPLAGLLLLLG